jgi:photosystem II stability/assembly factor-like uncharacterized protein
MRTLLKQPLLLLLLASCATSSPAPGPDAGGPDAGGPDDASAEADAGRAPDAGFADATPADAGDPAAYRSAILGASWRPLEGAPTISGKQDDLWFVDTREGFSVNGEGRLFHTIDGGETWERLVDQPGTFFRSILMLDARRGFAGNIGPGYFPGVTDPVPLYETRDGRTWTPVDRITGPAVAGVCNMFRLDDTHLFAVGRVGGPSFIMDSVDGGETWRSRDLSGQLEMLIDVRFSTPMDGLLVGRNPRGRCAVLRTADGGDTWTEVFQSAVSGTLCWKLSFPSSTVGYVSIQGGSRSTFAKTTDGGESWEELPLLPGERFRGLGAGFITEDIGWMASDAGAWKTTDGGATWTRDTSLGRAINRFRFVDAHTAYAIGTTIYKLEIPKD